MTRGSDTALPNLIRENPGSAISRLAIPDPPSLDYSPQNLEDESQTFSTALMSRIGIEPLDKRFDSTTWPRPEPSHVSGGQYNMLDIGLFVEKVYYLSGRNQHLAVDTVYNFMDDCLLDRDFMACDAALMAVRPEKLAHSVLLSFLIVTQRAKGILANRQVFYERAFTYVSKTNGQDYAKELLGNNR